MKASYKWLKEFADFNLSAEELAHILTMSGFEVEAIEKHDDDEVFDIGVTPNRPDCLSIRGIAREISAILDVPFREVSPDIGAEQGDGPVVEIEDPLLCLRYASRIVSGVKPGPSPDWMVKRLESCGFRSTSNIVDITNYIQLEIGQPLHAFDLDRLEGKKIVVKTAGDVRKFSTLDNEERSLSKDMLLIWDAEKPVAVAGVMGGLDTEVSDATTSILLESAYFMPSSVRRTSKFLGLSSESSYRFERGVDIEAVTLALDRAAQMISEIAGGRITSCTDEYPSPLQTKKISVPLDKINSVIGVDIDRTFIEKTLHRLGLNIEREGGDLMVIPPAFRNDIERDIDIIEEVARLYGYDNIPSTLPTIQMSAAPEHRTRELIKNMKSYMIRSGFSEVINYSFLNPELLDTLNLSSDDRRRNLIYVKNPLRKEDSAMRTTLVPALLNNVSLNLNHGERMLRMFEISRVFLSSNSRLPDEVTQLSAVYLRDNSASLWKNAHEGFYDVKGVLENILSDLKIADVSFVPDPAHAEPYLHPGKSCAVFLKDDRIGSFGTLHPGVAESFDIRGDITVAEIYDLGKILHAISVKTKYVPLPRYPYAERDIALIVGKDVPVSLVKSEIHNIKSDIVESVNLFDVYTGKPVPPDKKSLAFAIRYRSPDRTLTDSEVDDMHSIIRNHLEKKLNAELRS